MLRCDLSEKEKSVLYYLVKHPSLNDRELSEKIGMKISTLTSIKNRLRKGEYYRTIRIPHLSYLGYELLWIRYGTYNQKKDSQEINVREKELIEELGLDTFYAVQEGHSFFSLNIARNYSESQKQIRAIEKDFQEKDYIEDFRYMFLPIDLTVTLFDFDYSMLLKNSFGIEDETYFRLPDALKAGTVIRDLRKSDVTILESLLQNPELPDTAIAAEIITTRQAVSRLRKKFEAEGILKTVRIPNIESLGYQILVFSKQSHNPAMVNTDLMEILEKHLLSNIPLVYINATELESIGISAFSDFYEFQSKREKLVAGTLSSGFISRVPEFILLSIPNQKVIHELDFSRIRPYVK
jgi:DNA-binding MarR family transcriptional regulator